MNGDVFWLSRGGGGGFDRRLRFSLMMSRIFRDIEENQRDVVAEPCVSASQR